MAKLKIYTDGGCLGNGEQESAGGWGAVLVFGEHVKELHGGQPSTTNNRMEMTALLQALRALNKEGLEIDLFSDSSYVIKCFRDKWYVKWQKNNWKNSSKEPVANADLWEELIAEVAKHRINFYLIKGHINPNSYDTTLKKHYDKFIANNGPGFSFDEFMEIARINNRVDELATQGISEVKNAKESEV